MVNENLDLPDLITSEFKFSRWRFEVQVPKHAVPRESINFLTAVTIRPDEPLDISGIMYPIVVFSARLNADLKLKQVAEGFPCKTEAQANEICQVIQAKNRKTPSVGLASWAGHFTLGTISNVDFFREELVLFKFHKPVLAKKRRCGYALRIYRHFVDRPREITWEKLLPTTSAKVAKEALAEKQTEWAAQFASKAAQQKQTDRPDTDLTPIQFKVLSKAYPKTISYISNPDPKNAEAAYAAYKQETLAVTGHLIDTLTKDEFATVAKLLEKAGRRKNPPLNAIEFQLVAGWRLQGYDKMSPQKRFEKLKALGFNPTSCDAVRKICERLKLPSLRKRGAPRKGTSQK